MLVPNVTNTQAPSFAALKSIKYKGLYKEFPEYKNELTNALCKNPEVENFCKTHDVEVIFNSQKQKPFGAICSLRMKYNQLNENLLQRFLNIFKPEKNIVIGTLENSFHLDTSVELGTERLKNLILPKGTTESLKSGMLSKHISKIMDK
jgi:hypothetical protein